MPQPLVLRVMVLALEADDHGGELVIGEDKVALAVMAVDEHAQGLEGTVNLIGSGRDKAGEVGHTNAYAQAATPLTAAQVWKAWVRAARYWTAGR